MPEEKLIIRRPCNDDWHCILEILKTSNFHRIGGSEMPDFPLCDCFIATLKDEIVGVAGYKQLDEIMAKTTLLVVSPKHRGKGIGFRLQTTRIAYLKKIGVKFLYTNCDDPKVIAWNIAKFGFKPSGRLITKTEKYGRIDKTHWVNLRMDLTD